MSSFKFLFLICLNKCNNTITINVFMKLSFISFDSSFSSYVVQGSVFRRIDALLGKFRVGGGVHDSYTFQCELVGYFTSPGLAWTPDRMDRRLLVSPPKDTGKAG